MENFKSIFYISLNVKKSFRVRSILIYLLHPLSAHIRAYLSSLIEAQSCPCEIVECIATLTPDKVGERDSFLLGRGNSGFFTGLLTLEKPCHFFLSQTYFR